MAKSKRDSKKLQYATILSERYGLRWEDARVLAFRFPDAKGPEKLHYALLFIGGQYWIFDCWDDIAQVVFPASDTIEQIIKNTAAVCGGIKVTPELN